jgi:adenine-specific DNA-methyltransferase
LAFSVLGKKSNSEIVLDFFSGSATTAHAVMQLNAEDGGNRKFIMVQLPEKTDEKSEAYKAGYKTVAEIGKERIRRAGKKIKEELEAKQKTEAGKLNFSNPGNPDNPKNQGSDFGFRVYKLDSSNMHDVYYRPQDYKQTTLDLFADNVKPGRTAMDLVTQVMLDWGLPLSLKIAETKVSGKQVFKVAKNSLFACFDNGIDEAFAKEIAKEQPLRIVFRDSSFASDTAKENVKQLLKQLSPETEMRVI